MIRNAGGRASDDAIRSFVISHKLLGTNEWFVVHHTDCGMEVRPVVACTRCGLAQWRVCVEPPTSSLTPPPRPRSQYFTSAQLAGLLETSLKTANIVPSAAAPKGVTFENASTEGGSRAGHDVHWLHIEDQVQSVKDDVAKITGHALTAPGIPVHGYVYNVKTGALEHIVSSVTA